MKEYDYPTGFSWWGEEEKEAIARVIASGWFTQGPEVEACEAEFAEYLGRKYAVMCNSGSSANLLAVAALFHKRDSPLKRGDKALVPAIAWPTTYSPLVQYGLDLVVADVTDTWNVPAPQKWNHLEGIKLVMGADILGNPGHFATVSGSAHTVWGWPRIAEEIGAYFIEDACESLGAEQWRTAGSGKCGSFGISSTLSFFASHQISAIEGGMVLTDDLEIADLCRMLRNHGWVRGIVSPDGFAEEYDFRIMGFNLRGLELHAALARAQLKKLDLFRRSRQQCYNNFELITKGTVINLARPNGVMSPFGCHFVTRDKETRDKLAISFREKGIDCRLPTGGSFTKHIYGAPWREANPTPVADFIHDAGIFIGCSAQNINDKLERAAGVIAEVCR